MIKAFRQNLAEGLKSFFPAGPSWSGSSFFGYGASRNSRVNYRSEVGELWQNATCMTCIAWMQRTLPEAPLQVVELNADGQPEPIPDHPLVRLFNRPNPHQSGKHLWQGVVLSFMSEGNAYLRKVRDGGQRVRELYYLPHWQVEPKPDSAKFIDRYVYTVNGKKTDIDPEDMIHFRYGINPAAPWLGMTPWASLLTEIATDNQSSVYSESILRNGGAIAGIASPADKEIVLQQGDADAIRDKLNAQIQAGNAGSWVVTHGSMQIEKLAFSPEEMTLDKLRTFPQDMICAAVGLSAMLLDLPGGALSKTYANKTEAREAAYESNLLPLLDLFGDELDIQLLRDFESGDNRFCTFDHSNVRVLQEDINALWQRGVSAHKEGILTTDETRNLIGYKDQTPEQQDELTPSPEPVPQPLSGPESEAVLGANGNGRG